MAVSAAMAMIVSAALARAVTANDLTTPPTQTLTYITLPLGRRSRLCHILTKTSRRDQEQPIIPVEGMGFGDMCDGRLYCRKFIHRRRQWRHRGRAGRTWVIPARVGFRRWDAGPLSFHAGGWIKLLFLYLLLI